MTDSAIVYTQAEDEIVAADELAKQVSKAFDNAAPDALIFFASPRYDHSALLAALAASLRPHALVGASSAGEFTSQARGDGACVMALRSSTMKFSSGIGRALSTDRGAAARSVTKSFKGLSSDAYPYRAALVMTDALAGHADDVVDELTLATSGKYQFFGGGAGDNAKFQRTPVFFGTEAVTDAVVALEMLSEKPIGVGVGHGWEPATPPMRVTEAHGSRLVSLNGVSAAQAFQKHALATGQTLDTSFPVPFFLHNILGVSTGGGFRLRVPLGIDAGGAVSCAADIPAGALVHIMRTTADSSIDAASRAATAALAGLKGNKPQAALFFDCVATRLRLGDVFGLELESIVNAFGAASLVGCNTHGQIARADGQFGGFHNCTAVVCALPQ
jgi:hypothetical protein